MPSTTADDVIAANIALIHKADAAVNARDIDGFLALMTDDVIWESTSLRYETRWRTIPHARRTARSVVTPELTTGIPEASTYFL